LAQSSRQMPTVLSGALYKDVWYLPAGESWAAKFIEDANADYLWKDTEGTGSLNMSLESVLNKGDRADYWISPSQFTSYREMLEANMHYQNFKPFKEKKVFTFAATRGSTGGLLYYELAPSRPDIVLSDLIYIFHPDLIPDYEPYFFKPLE
ncbi:MAG: ABC transporter substrate-binding protein, partial [Flavobacteriaceae bacterium]